MKASHSPRGGRILIGFFALVGIGSQASADSKIPRGTLTVDSSLVRVGAQSQLGWQIQYPSQIDDIVEVETPDVLIPQKDLQMRVRVLGSSFQNVKNNNGHGNNVDGMDASNPGGVKTGKTDTNSRVDDEKTGSISMTGAINFPIEVVWSKNSADWSRIFYGRQSEVVPTAVILNTKVAAGDTINFGGRCYINEWLPLYTTNTSTPNLVILKNGDPVPTSTSSYRVGQLRGYLKPYLSSDYQTIKIGENDFIIVMELDQSNSADAGFDLQDLAMLVTFQ